MSIYPNPKHETPMMRQFHEAKKVCPEALLLFRMGDFYEMFLEDAKIGAKILGLALTSREKGADGMPMAGFPHHQLDAYIAKIIAAGYRAAVCDQIEDPKTAKGIVKRAVTRIVSAGTITEETLLDPKASNYLAAVLLGTDSRRSNPDRRSEAGLAWVELSTGDFFAAAVPQNQLMEHLARIAPAEILYSDKESFQMPPQSTALLTKRPDWTFGLRSASAALLAQFGTATLEGFGFSADKPSDIPAICAAGAVIDYLNETQKQSSVQIASLTPYRLGSQLEIDEASRRSLEITLSIRGSSRHGALLGIIDRCVTPMGSRVLAEAVVAPLTDINQITARQDAIEELYRNDQLVSDLREQLRKVYDISRILTRVLQNRCTPRDLVMIGRTLRALPFFREKLATAQSPILQSLCCEIDPCEDLERILTAAFEENASCQIREGGFIKAGFHAELDELRSLQTSGKDWIAKYQAAEIARTGIPTLKVGYTSVFGYYIEITNVHQTKIPVNYTRKQTLKNAERYITPELKEYEEKVLTAVERAIALEVELFEQIRAKTCEYRPILQRVSRAIAVLDTAASCATIARERGYCRPKLVAEPVLNIVDGRHPVLDALEPAGTFVPNDTAIGEKKDRIQLITGPNMAGKSTFIRQNALLCIMAQIGSFIPARAAEIGICDRIFARVGASDEIARGQSTFMVEMTETARILNQSTQHSLVILDEVGRGTSTYDGLSLAWAIVEYLHNRIDCRTLFATHYHELTDLSETMDGVCNLNVAVREERGEVVFLHKIIRGAADKSYGIHVAKLAGVPSEVVERSQVILNELETQHYQSRRTGAEQKSAVPSGGTKFSVGGVQFSLFGSDDHPILAALRELDVNGLRPLDALKLVSDWKMLV
ncbi:MAG: DNA mismatch repair protein MutS [Planctomycetaceae bacterium]|jgi:DNA mismatch repair protein MutS|nr:DNA mismatch repair protein MutS [Planctomycetaceae bacterium]